LVFVVELGFLLLGCLVLAVLILVGEHGSSRLWAAGASLLCGLRQEGQA
jgi:hypothetical protein